MTNPFTLLFGKKPIQYVSRIAYTNEIVNNFYSENPINQVYLISGVRGSGKTVMLSNIAAKLRERDDWIVIELNPTRDLLQSLAARIYGIQEMYTRFVKAKLNLSFMGATLSVENTAPVTDIENVLELMLAQIKEAGKKLLVTIDEVVNSEYMKVFTSAFQIFVRQDYPIFLLMTGLYENIYELQNDKALTFLYRAPKIILEPLNLAAVRRHYMDIFDIDMELAEKMAVLTRGYPFAFQVLGYLYWENRSEKTVDELMPEYDQYLSEYVYEKIWDELSATDKQIVRAMAVSGETKVKAIRECLQMTSEKFSVYRERLRRKGIVNTAEYGRMTFVLPRFEDFIQMQIGE